MTKSFKTDSERNDYFNNVADYASVPRTLKYVDGVLHQDNVIVTDSEFVKQMNNMFHALSNLTNDDSKFLERAGLL